MLIIWTNKINYDNPFPLFVKAPNIPYLLLMRNLITRWNTSQPMDTCILPIIRDKATTNIHIISFNPVTIIQSVVLNTGIPLPTST